MEDGMNNAKWQRQMRDGSGIDIEKMRWILKEGELYWLGQYRPGYNNRMFGEGPFLYVGAELQRGEGWAKMVPKFIGPDGVITFTWPFARALSVQTK
jgi:hypothetical protein